MVNIYILPASRIGEFALACDTILRSGQRGFGICSKPANEQLYKMYGRVMKLTKTKYARFIATKTPLMRLMKNMEAITDYSEKYQSDIFNTEPVIKFNYEEELLGKELLKRMGIDSWFICFHSRDSQYLRNRYKMDCSYHDFRDSSIYDYLDAAKYVISKGGYAVRVGYDVKEILPKIDKLIDYSNDYRTDFGDIYLLAKCKFFLCNTSGLFQVATSFNTPIVAANWIPIGCNLPYRKGDMYIRKKLVKDGRYLSDDEILNSEIGKYVRLEQYNTAGIEIINNTPDEILNITKAMCESLGL